MRLPGFVKVNAQEYRIEGAFIFTIGKLKLNHGNLKHPFEIKDETDMINDTIVL